MAPFYEAEYEIHPVQPFRILRSCAGCGRKMSYVSTQNFRVNANGNLLDVWLIYQCPKCRHTYNLPIYLRVRADRIETEEYERFLKNDPETALRYGLERKVFTENRAEIDRDAVEYEVCPLKQAKVPEKTGNKRCILRIRNPYGLKVRIDRLAAGLLGISRSCIQRREKAGELEIRTDPADGTIEFWENGQEAASTFLQKES